MEEKQKIFKNNFDFKSEGFSNPVDLIDTKIGFSITKKMWPDGYFSMFKILIKDKDLESEKKLKPLSISVNYGKIDDDGSLILSSSNGKKNPINSPINLISKDEFYYNPETNEFFEKNKNINANEIFRRVYNLHTKPSKIICGFSIRIKIFFFRIIAVSIIKMIYYFLVLLLYITSGKKLSKSSIYDPEEKTIPPNRWVEQKHIMEQFKENEKLTLLGYKGNFWAIIFFCHITFCIIYNILDI